MNKQDIVPRFQSKLSKAIVNFSEKFNISASDIKIIIRVAENENKQPYLLYYVFGKQSKVCDAKFNDIIKLDMLEGAFINKEKIEDFIINSFNKFSVGRGCLITDIQVMIFMVNDIVYISLLDLWTIIKQKYKDKTGNIKERDYININDLF